ncbi:MAG TPA: NADH-quinone oxidoreductase subunit L [Verrucomicrobiota bacterium]|nr:NADH-quinone oxidoreductase subunit L [Verrucomicrobiota bacterium]HNU51833.1 NADH-quinone oxidoreductase subunit L [Verrucomicrobiota bacterium]
MSPQIQLVWLILLLPLAAAAGITLATLRHGRLSAALSIGAVIAAFAASLLLFVGHVQGRVAVPWISLTDGTTAFLVDLGLRLDPLSALMLLVVTGVAGVIHLYSYGYMADDPGMGRYYAGLSFFTFAMTGIVLADNFLVLFIFWELVGAASYLLIGFWHQRPAAADAGKKAFLVNRIGDFGFLLGLLLLWATLGSLDYAVLESKLDANPHALGPLATAVGLLVFCGAVGKSAQFPLHVWLPDAMEGPTPVSALIHAATMVAAGVYLLCRVFFLLALPDSQALPVIAWTGAITALIAALMAIQQNDLKRILAYSTLSQLGYMVMAVGLSGAQTGPDAGFHHLITHAFFKALLFLGAGSVIHALHHEQDIWHMGALGRRLPLTFVTFLAGTLALCGLPPFSGFFSKDAILALAQHQSPPLFALGVGVAFLTAFYMARLVFVAFLGPARTQQAREAHESPLIMTVPLALLTVPTVLSGFWGLGQACAHALGPSGPAPTGIWATLAEPFTHAPLAAAGGLLAALGGMAVAGFLYHGQLTDPLPSRLGALARILANRFYIDEFYAWLIRVTQEPLARCADWIDRWIIAGLMVRGTHGTFEIAGRLLRLAQTGNLQTYALWFAAGALLLLAGLLAR